MRKGKASREQMRNDFNQEFIIKKCKEHTLLGNDEIESILDVAKTLHYFNLVTDCDAYIDIKIHNEEKAVVVAESFSKKSIYTDETTFLDYIVLRENEPAVFRTFDLGEETHEVIGISYGKDGSEILAKQTVIPILHEKMVVAVLLLEKPLSTNPRDSSVDKKPPYNHTDLTETMLSIFGFGSGDERLQIREGVLVFDETGYLIYYNRFADAIYKEFGYRSIESLHYDSLNFSSVHFEDLAMLQDSGLREDRSLCEPTDNMLCKEEKISIGNKSYNIRIAITKRHPIEIVVFIDDISEIIKYENEINNYLVTYREIHHRIKNNLQTVASLLRLQGRICKDPEARMILSESINRILSIAVTHDLLSRKNGNQASILEVLNSLKQGMIISAATPLEIHVSGDDFYLDSDKSTVVALVVNELLQNSVKYAFPGKPSGQIRIKTISNGDIKVIEVKDNGVGYDPDQISRDSLGLMIVKTYVKEKLAGKLIVQSGEEGTRTSFAFKV